MPAILSGLTALGLIASCGAASSRNVAPTSTSQTPHDAPPSAAAHRQPQPVVEPACEKPVAEVTRKLSVLAIAKDQDGALQGIFELGKAGLVNCPDDETLWYALVRSAELGCGAFPAAWQGFRFDTSLDLARYAASRAPASARINTVLARLLGTVSAARDALALDPTYSPASAALAAALLAAGDTDAALQLLLLPAVGALPGANTLRAGAELAQSKFDAAISYATRDLNATWSDQPEPFLISIVRRDAEETIGLALLARGRTREAVPHLHAAAALGSLRAQAALAERNP